VRFVIDSTAAVSTSGLFAHTRNRDGKWHLLEEHLQKVARKASESAAYFQMETPAFWIGLWHDLGKANPAFQKYLKDADQGISSESVPHAFGGAALIYAMLWQQQQCDSWKDLALAIAGHHVGLHDAGVLAQRLEGYVAEHRTLLHELLSFAKQLPTPGVWKLPKLTARERELFIRFTFSALVDADYLDTESHFSPEISKARIVSLDACELWRRFEKNQRALLEQAETRPGTNAVLMAARKDIYEACLSAAQAAPGFFRLTVPTGGGKTRSSLAFALQHILVNDSKRKRPRVIVAIPYTSIIDQTVREYRRILGHDAVLEHHSQVPIPEDESQSEETMRLRLASENWDASVIVTTNVQLFESLLSNRPGKVRKLHNIAGSVIILDEAQTLPVGVLAPALDVLKTLVEDYNVSVVLSSATQPAFHTISEMIPTDIVVKSQFEKHFVDLARVSYERKGKVSWAELAAELRKPERNQIMVVLNSRKDALRLIDELREANDVYHLSTLLCGWHRKAILRLIRRRIRHGKPVRLISTQVVEAGVDIDFPEVWRAIGPLDRIVQAAGRCNREGRMASKGRVVIFEPVDGRMPKGEYQAGFGLADFLLGQNDPETLHNPSLHEEYFRRLYAEQNLDVHKVQPHRETLNYPETARLFRLISDDTVLVAVPYGQGSRRLTDWKNRPSRATWRRLQPFVVNLQRREAERLLADDWLELVSEGLYRWIGKYDRIKGLAEAAYDPADLMM
jgi:CRISPR-associated endonuclease/helicase Cas3